MISSFLYGTKTHVVTNVAQLQMNTTFSAIIAGEVKCYAQIRLRSLRKELRVLKYYKLLAGIEEPDIVPQIFSVISYEYSKTHQ